MKEESKFPSGNGGFGTVTGILDGGFSQKPSLLLPDYLKVKSEPSWETLNNNEFSRSKGRKWSKSTIYSLLKHIFVCEADLYILMLYVSQSVSQFTLFEKAL